MTEKETEKESIQESRPAFTKRIVIRMDSWEYGYLKEVCDAVGEPVNKFILSAIRLRLVFLLLERKTIRSQDASLSEKATQKAGSE